MTVVQDSSLIFFCEVTFYCKIYRASIEGSEETFLQPKSREKVIEAANKLCDLSLVTNVHVSDQR